MAPAPVPRRRAAPDLLPSCSRRRAGRSARSLVSCPRGRLRVAPPVRTRAGSAAVTVGVWLHERPPARPTHRWCEQMQRRLLHQLVVRSQLGARPRLLSASASLCRTGVATLAHLAEGLCGSLHEHKAARDPLMDKGVLTAQGWLSPEHRSHPGAPCLLIPVCNQRPRGRRWLRLRDTQQPQSALSVPAQAPRKGPAAPVRTATKGAGETQSCWGAGARGGSAPKHGHGAAPPNRKHPHMPPLPTAARQLLPVRSQLCFPDFHFVS